MINLKSVTLLLGFFLILTILFLNQFLIKGSEKIPAYMLTRDEAPEITEDQRKDAEIYFGGHTLIYKLCFDHFINDKKEPSELKYKCVTFLPTKNPPWALEHLFNYLGNDDPEIREGAADGLQLYQNDKEIFSKLTEAWAREKNLKVYAQLAIALSKYDGSAAEVFRRSIKDPDNEKKITAALSLYDLTSDTKDLYVLKKLFDEGSPQTKRFLVVSAWILYKDKLKPVLRWGINGKDPKTKEILLKLLKQGHL